MGSKETTGEPSQAEFDFEAHNWRQARETFQLRHKDNEKRQAFLGSQTDGITVKDTCLKLQNESDTKYHKSLGGILDKISALMDLGDIAIKSAPESVGLAWMGVRMCLNAVQGDYATFQLFSGACADIVGIMISCRVYGKMFGHKEGPDDFQELHNKVVDYIPGIYADVLDFSYAVRKYTDKHVVIRIGKNIFRDHKGDFQAMIDGIQDHETKMRNFANMATDRWLVHYQKEGLKNQGVVMADLRSVKEALDVNLKANEAFVRHIEALEEERKDMRRKAPEEKARDEFEENARLLDPTEDQSDILQENVDHLREPGTCQWIFELDEYDQWHNSSQSSMLWVSGGGGYGKSILMSTVIESLKAEFSSSRDTVVQYFFCKNGHDSTQHTARVLQTFIYQLYASTETSDCGLEKANEIIRLALGKKTGEQTASGKKAVSQETTIVNLLKAMKRNVFLVIDAVDECIDREEMHLIRTLRKCVEMNRDTQLRIMIASRPEPDIANGLQNIPVVKCEGHNEDDIRMAVTSGMKKFPGWTAFERLSACNEIVRKAGGQFRYVPIALEFLRKPLVRPYSKALNNLPNGLTGSYLTSWDNTDPEYLDLLKTALTWTMLTEGTITVSEVMDAYSRTYSADAGIQEDREEDTVDIENTELHDQQIRIAGGNFLEVSSSHVISLRHMTVRDFFTEHRKEESQIPRGDVSVDSLTDNDARSETLTESGSKWVVSEKEGHLAILKVLVQNLVSPIFQKEHLFSNEIVSYDTLNTDQGFEQWVEEADAMADQLPTPESDEVGSGLVDGPSDALDSLEPPMDHASDDVDSATNDSDEHSTESFLDNDDAAVPQGDDARHNGEAIKGGDSVVSGKNSNNRGFKGGDSGDHSGDNENNRDSDSDANDDEFEHDEWSDDEEYVDDQARENRQSKQQKQGNIDKRRKYRYELTHWQHHLAKAEQLWSQDERESNIDWIETLEALYQFMHNNEAAFKTYYTLMSRDESSDLYTGQVDTVWSPLQVAAIYGLVSLAKLFISKGDKVDERTTVRTKENWHQSPLELVLDSKPDPDLKMVKLLLENGADPNASHDGPTAFHWACEMDPKTDALQLFLDFGAKTNIQDYWGSNVMHCFARGGNDPEQLQMLIKAGGNVNYVDYYGETPLHSLVSRDDIPIDLLEALLAAGAGVNVENNYSESKKLYQHDVNLANGGGTGPLFGVAAKGDLRAAELLIQHGADIHDDNTRGLTALDAAALAGSVEVVELLVEKGAEINKTDHFGRTPFYFACQGGHEGVAQYLLDLLWGHPMDEINRADKKGRTPFRKAAARGSLSIVQLLLPMIDAGQAINAADSTTGQTAVHRAAYNGEKAVLEVLLEAGADISLTDKEGRTPLEICAQGWSEADDDSHEDALITLIEACRETAAKSMQVLFTAVMKGSTRIVRKLLEMGADPTVKDEHGWTPRILAEQYNQQQVIEVLNRQQRVVQQGPTRWVSPAKHIEIGSDGLIIFEKSKARIETTVITDHPIPAGAASYYFEVTIMDMPPPYHNVPEASVVLVGLVPMPVRLVGKHPGFRGWHWASSDGFVTHADDLATLYGGGPFRISDTIGCAVDFVDDIVFYTRNGQRLGKAFDNVFGRLFPAVGTARNVTVTTKLGTDDQSFRWRGWKEWQEEREQEMKKRRERKSEIHNGIIAG